MNMYYIAMVAPEDINKEVLKWKQFMQERYGCSVALKSPAHITLIPPFWMIPDLENDLVNSIKEFSRYQQSFTVQLKDFSAFKPRVIFIDISKNEQLDSLQHSFESIIITTGKYPVKKDNRPFHPHVTLATRDLHKKAFYEAWEIFEKKHYEALWNVKGISLLRHNKKNWEVIFTSQFL